MQRRSFWILLSATVAAVVLVALTIPGNRTRDANQDGVSLFEGLSDRINELDRLSVHGAGGQQLVSLVRGARTWTISELSSYPADWRKVREVLTGVAWASVSEIKTSNPEYFARLGVEDINAEDASGLLLDIGIGDDRYQLILGHEAESRNGQYVRISGVDQSYLIAETIDVPATPIDWAEDIIVDVGSGLVAEVTIEHADGERLTVSRVSADDSEFSLHDVPEGRETLAAWAINRLGAVFTQVRMEDVMPESRFSGDSETRVRVLTFSGLELDAEVFNRKGEAWIQIHAKSHESASQNRGSDTAEGAPEDSTEDFVNSEIAAIEQRTSGWVYKISGSKHDELVKRTNDLLKVVEGEPAPSSQ